MPLLDENSVLIMVLVVLVISLSAAMVLTSLARNAQNAQNEDNGPDDSQIITAQPAIYPGQWWLNTLIDDPIHTMLVGKSRSGKTYLAQTLLTAFTLAGHRVMIIDPHVKADQWPGLPVVGRGKKYLEVEKALMQLLEEADRRFEKWGNVKGYDPEPLEIFIDEARAIAQHCPSAPIVFKEGSSEWAKIKMRIHLQTQSALVQSLGFQGEGQLRENYNAIYLANQATAKLSWLAVMDRPALFDYNDRFYPIDVTWLTSYLQTHQPNLQMVWQGLQNLQVLVPGSENLEKIELKATTRTSELDLIKALLKGGLNPSQIVQALGGNRQARFDQVNQILQQETGK